MNLSIRIKATDEPAAVKALWKVGGRVKKDERGRYSFVFSDQAVYDEYCRLVRLYKAN